MIRYYLVSSNKNGLVVAQALTRRQATKRRAKQPKLGVYALDQAAFDRVCHRHAAERARLFNELQAKVETTRQDFDRQHESRSHAL